MLYLPAAKVHCFNTSVHPCGRPADDINPGRPKDNLYEPALADSEREAVADLLQYLENVWWSFSFLLHYTF